jgi:menaquinone-dependent protoporphyrinogen oxidase
MPSGEARPLGRGGDMSSILMVYGSTHGQTGRIVERLASNLTVAGHRVTTWKGDQLPARPVLAGYDGYVIAGSVRYGKYQPYLVEFARANAERLSAMPSVFVSVCGALIGDWAAGPAEARKYEASFQRLTGWTPSLARSLPGALNYTRYGMLTRFIMQMISRRTGRPTDTSRDWDGTDWAAVDRLAGEIGELVRAPAVVHTVE